MRGTEFWRGLFGNDASVEIEIGSGDGVLLLGMGRRCPSRNFLGIERSPSKATRLAARLLRVGAANIRALQADATCVVASIIPSGSVTAYHVYFPDPWPKRGHAGRRIFSSAFVGGLARTLTPDGHLFFATDVQVYAAVARDRILEHGGFVESAPAGDHPGFGTSFARKYRAAGRPLYAYTFVHVAVSEAAQRLAASKMRSM